MSMFFAFAGPSRLILLIPCFGRSLWYVSIVPVPYGLAWDFVESMARFPHRFVVESRLYDDLCPCVF